MPFAKGNPGRPKGSRNKVRRGATVVTGTDNADPGVTVVPGTDPVVIDGVATVIDPATFDGNGADDGGNAAGPERRRSRGGGRSKKKATHHINVSSIEMMLFSCHNMLAAMTKVEELEMTEKEAKTIAEAISNVAECYDHVPGMSENAAAWTNLAMCLGMAYVPRVMHFRARVAGEK